MRQNTRTRTIVLTSILTLCLVACGSGKKDLEKEDTRPPEEIYNSATKKLDEHSYKSAAKEFLNVEKEHPYSKWAGSAQIQAAYAYYKAEQYDDAINTLQRFTKMSPGSPDVSYAYYLIALSYYNRISDVGRDQDMTLKARQALKDVIARYPNSDYARDAQFKLELTEDQLAGKEMEVGRYYLKRKQYVAAINRFKVVVDQYPKTAQIEEALERLVECYVALGVTPEAQKYAAVLGHNYPGGVWYQDAYGLLLNGKLPGEEKQRLKLQPQNLGTSSGRIINFSNEHCGSSRLKIPANAPG